MQRLASDVWDASYSILASACMREMATLLTPYTPAKACSTAHMQQVWTTFELPFNPLSAVKLLVLVRHKFRRGHGDLGC